MALKKFQQRKSLTDVLVEMGFLTSDAVKKAVLKSHEIGEPLEAVLLADNTISEEDLAKALAEKSGLHYVDLSNAVVDPSVLLAVPLRQMAQHGYWVLAINQGAFDIVVSDPSDIVVLDKIRAQVGKSINFCVSSHTQIVQMHKKAEALKLENQGNETKNFHLDGPHLSGQGPVTSIKPKVSEKMTELVEEIILEAIKRKASDIHIEPEEDLLRVRARIDGVLHELRTLELSVHSSMISRLKILGRLDIAEKRNAQDGSFRQMVSGRVIDVRMSTLPTVQGERAVLRLLDKSSMKIDLDEIGLIEADSTSIKNALASPYGMLLVTGPTGSGKTTTVYSMLKHLNHMDTNIITIEDPVEYQFELINQVQVNPNAGLIFSNVLRSVLRQDPDVIMVGEIRDEETATLAVEAALTGHLVISTLHTNDALGTVHRLLEMGVESYLLSSSLLGVVAQRLVRVLCPSCKTKGPPSDADLVDLRNLNDPRFTPSMELFRAVGCAKCLKTGYTGRQPVFEFLQMDEDMKIALNEDRTGAKLEKIVNASDFRSIREDGLQKVLSGTTTISEVLKATL